ncbi:MAG TPA: AmmeMemoRadiSam system protein B [Planctomycetota bacterium]|nr:AmmeMemoRadiSam system protein B [Planctomycetota bacterium]HRR79170.1 AmmeMemoRadiSam system protein B [Planctomycetota bacterium]HRT93969.1 AmmeMemoRadiSam system protein B [Planctomycetota bacterium]
MVWLLDSAAAILLLCLAMLVVGESTAAEEAPVREPAVAGQFYPAEASALKKQVAAFLEAGAGKAKVEGKPIALIAPHAGYDYSGRCAGVAYATVKGQPYKRVIVLAVNHRGMPFRGGSILSVDAYRTPLGNVPVDKAACATLRESELFGEHPSAQRMEHSLEVHLPFLQEALGTFQLVPIVLGDLADDDYAAMATLLRKVMDQDTLVVASSDFTHYGRNFGFAPFEDKVRENIEKLDKGAIDLILRRDGPGFAKYLARTGATICGRCPIRVLLQLLPDRATGQLVSYYASGDEANDYRHSVSYGAIVFTAPGQWGEPPAAKPTVGPLDVQISEAGQKKLLEIARKALEAVTAGKDLPETKLDDAELQGRNGVFVTLNKDGQLRGCIGNFRPETPLYETVAVQTQQSALHDPRFQPVQPAEVKDIEIEISVLMPEKPIKDPLGWEFGKHGIIVRRGWQQATFLPQVAEHFKTKEEMLSACCRKAGMLSAMWRDPETSVLIYSAQVFGEKPAAKAK